MSFVVYCAEMSDQYEKQAIENLANGLKWGNACGNQALDKVSPEWDDSVRR
jgi:hypothetical protein